MVNQSDRKAAEFVCLKHHSLRGELQSLRIQYDQYIDYAKKYAMRIEETEEKLEDLTLNVNQFFCDALDALVISKSGGARLGLPHMASW